MVARSVWHNDWNSKNNTKHQWDACSAMLSVAHGVVRWVMGALTSMHHGWWRCGSGVWYSGNHQDWQKGGDATKDLMVNNEVGCQFVWSYCFSFSWDDIYLAIPEILSGWIRQTMQQSIEVLFIVCDKWPLDLKNIEFFVFIFVCPPCHHFSCNEGNGVCLSVNIDQQNWEDIMQWSTGSFLFICWLDWNGPWQWRTWHEIWLEMNLAFVLLHHEWSGWKHKSHSHVSFVMVPLVW